MSMIRRMEKFTQCLQEAYQFSLSRQFRIEALSEVIQSLDKINNTINGRRLNFQVFSQFPLLNEGMINWLNSHQTLRNFYKTQISELTAFSSSSHQNQSPKLILSANPGVSQSETRYKLSLSQNIVIGRDLQGQTNSSLIEISLPMYKKLSGRHAEVGTVTNLNSSIPSWQICDLNSTNGTYINGQKIKGCQILKSGDKITLGYPNPSEKAPEFIFEGQVQSSTQGSSVTQLIDGDFICLVISPNKELSDSEKQLFDQASRTKIAGFIIIADNSGLSSADNQKVTARLSSIESSIQHQFPRLAEILGTIALPLHPFYPNISPAPLAPLTQQIFNGFSEDLINLAKTDGARILIDRANRQLQEQLRQIDAILSNQQEALNKEVNRTKSILQGRSIESLGDHFTREMKQVSEEREDFFRQSVNEFNIASNDFASNIIPNSLTQKIQDFVKNLDPVVNKVNGQVTIGLQPSNGVNLYEFVLSFIRSEIIKWGDYQWKYIRQNIHGHGLEGLLKESYSKLNCLPNFQMNDTFHQPPYKIELTNSLSASFADLPVDISYSESSGDAFNGIAKIAIMSAAAAFNIGASISSGQNLSPQAIMQGANVIQALSGMAGASVSRTQQQNLKIEQVVDSLKRNTYIHYQQIAQNLLRRASQEILTVINLQERQFRKSLEGIEEQFRGYYSEFKTISDAYKARQQTLDQDKQAFEQIKNLSG
jgi:FHA domain